MTEPLTRKRRRKVHRQRMRVEKHAYGVFVASCVKFCRCHRDICDSVMAGGICDDVQETDYDDAEVMAGDYMQEEYL